MLTNEDLQAISDLFDKKFDEKFDEKIKPIQHELSSSIHSETWRTRRMT